MKETFMMRESIYSVPFSHIPYGSKIVIYGGGKLGENYFRKIRLSKRAQIVAIIDAQAERLPNIFGNTPLYKPDRIGELRFDYILIAVEDTKSADDIRQLLYDYNISDCQIISNNKRHFINEEALHEIIKCFERNIENEKRRFFLFMLPEHGNLGDYVIGYAEFAFFRQYFHQYDVYGITTSEWLSASEFYINLIKPDDIIFINGGGFLGDLWGDAKFYRHIISGFPHNIKIFFPNTLTYKEKLCKQNKAFIKDMEWFGKQENLYIFFRESMSYYLFSQYEKRCFLFPDMAFYLHFERDEIYKKNKVLLCLRDDCERIFYERSELENSLKNAHIDYDSYDIYMKKYISQQAGRRLLQYTVQMFQSYDCIITDRLHGMILAIVSNVPCIAFDNRTHKISSVYDSIKDMQHVRMMTDERIDHISQIINAVFESKLKAGPYKPPVTDFEKMADKIYELLDSTM